MRRTIIWVKNPETHLWSITDRYTFSFLNNAYGHQDEMGGEVSTRRYVLKDC